MNQNTWTCPNCGGAMQATNSGMGVCNNCNTSAPLPPAEQYFPPVGVAPGQASLFDMPFDELSPSQNFQPQQIFDNAPQQEFQPQQIFDNAPEQNFQPQQIFDVAPEQNFQPQQIFENAPEQNFQPQQIFDVAPEQNFQPQQIFDVAPEQNFQPQQIFDVAPEQNFQPQQIFDNAPEQNFQPQQIFDNAPEQNFQPQQIFDVAPEQNFQSHQIFDVAPEQNFQPQQIFDVAPEQNFQPQQIFDVAPEQNFQPQQIFDVAPQQEFQPQQIFDNAPEQNFQPQQIFDNAPQQNFQPQQIFDNAPEQNFQPHQIFDVAPEQNFQPQQIFDNAPEQNFQPQQIFDNAPEQNFQPQQIFDNAPEQNFQPQQVQPPADLIAVAPELPLGPIIPPPAAPDSPFNPSLQRLQNPIQPPPQAKIYSNTVQAIDPSTILDNTLDSPQEQVTDIARKGFADLRHAQKRSANIFAELELGLKITQQHGFEDPLLYLALFYASHKLFIKDSFGKNNYYDMYKTYSTANDSDKIHPEEIALMERIPSFLFGEYLDIGDLKRAKAALKQGANPSHIHEGDNFLGYRHHTPSHLVAAMAYGERDNFDYLLRKGANPFIKYEITYPVSHLLCGIVLPSDAFTPYQVQSGFLVKKLTGHSISPYRLAKVLNNTNTNSYYFGQLLEKFPAESMDDKNQ